MDPQVVWDFFKQISRIPRCSRHEEKIREFLVNFAKENNFQYKVDDAGNVLIKSGDSDIILQCHMDMVCEKNADVDHDFSKDPIKLIIKDGKITADGTTLGADNGIGMAIALSLLLSKKVQALFTTSEESGLIGASNLDKSMLQAKYLINLDSEDFGVITIGSAGGENLIIKMPLSYTNVNKKGFLIKVKGLKGGHSGVDIHKQRGNAIKILSRILYKIPNCQISSISGGNKHNAIPREAQAVIIGDNVKEIVKLESSNIKEELKYVDPELSITIEELDVEKVINESSKIINLLVSIPHGVVRYNDNIKGLVEISNNLGIVRTNEELKIVCCSRAFEDHELNYIINTIEAICKLANVNFEREGRYPGWAPSDSHLLEVAKKVFRKLFNYDIKVEAVHAGLETGIIGSKNPDLQMISIGPTIKYPHSPDEYVEIESVDKFYKYLSSLIDELS